MNNIIIAGGSGLIGRRLTEMLLQKGYSVTILSRRKHNSKNQKVEYVQWDPDKGMFPEYLLSHSETIINLAGANIGTHGWTNAYKQEILSSRVNSTRTIVRALNKDAGQVKTLINGSAVGYYGYDRGKKMKEEDAPGTDFVAEVCKLWEGEMNHLQNTAIRTVVIRTGIVLSTHEGAMPKMALPVKFMAGAPLGTGKQVVSWIHIDDICSIFLYALENAHVQGAYNGVAPAPVSNKVLTKAIARSLHRPLILPPVPAFVLKLMVGEMADSVLGSSDISDEKIRKAGFTFAHPEVFDAVADLYRTGK